MPLTQFTKGLTMLATKYIIALCPATPRYLHADTANQFSSEGFYATADKAKARLFDTFEAAMDVAKNIKGWGGAQRVEQVAVEVKDTRQTLATDEDLCEVRDLCTSEWVEACDASDADYESPRTTVTRAEKWIVTALKDRGLKVSTENRATEDDRTTPSNPLTVYTADHLGNTAQFDWDPMIDGFDITEATCLAEGEPETATCDGCENAFPVDEVEVCGSAEHGPFGFCAACRAKDANAPRD